MTTKSKIKKLPRKSASGPRGSATPKTGSLTATVYTIKGEKSGTINLPEYIFGVKWNADLVHQVVTSMQSNARRGLAHTKGSGDVRGGGKKPWQQKGTGRARHGSSRSPIWKGGGVSHGPRNDKNYERIISRSMRSKALLVTLSRKWKDGEVIFVDTLRMETPKTALGKQMLENLSAAGLKANVRNAALIALPDADRNTLRSFSNIGNVEVVEARNLNPVSILGKKFLVVASPEAVFETLGKKKAVKRTND